MEQPSKCRNANLRFTQKGAQLVNGFSSLCLEAASGGKMTQARWGSAAAQKWELENGRMKSASSGLCVTLA